MTPRKIRISAHGHTGTVELDGQDISHAVQDVAVKMHAGDTPQVTLGLALHALDESDLDAEVRIPDATRDLLVSLGWTPPGEQPKPRVRIENHAAGSPEALAAELEFLLKRP